VNVLLVPAHPGFPGQIPQIRKTVVVVVVLLRMIDDYDECEWVNVSFVTGLPGLSQTKSTEL